MQTRIRYFVLVVILLASLGSTSSNQPPAPPLTTLHSFTAVAGPNPSTNGDGTSPSGLILSSNIIYGSAYHGGAAGNGAIFSVKTDGSGFTNLHSFTVVNPTTHTNLDGINPEAGVLLSSNMLYGTASAGGSNGNGTIFSIKTDGTLFKVLHSFTALVTNTNGDGALPLASLILSGNSLYGTAVQGGAQGSGTVFRINTDGTGFTNLHSFTAVPSQPPYTNSDGAQPQAPLFLSANLLYGTTYFAGKYGNGVLFKLNTNGSGFSNFYNFTAVSTNGGTNSDGAYLEGGLLLISNVVYGSSYTGGHFAWGTVFKVNNDGTDFSALHHFDYTDGAYPEGGLQLSGNTLFGATAQGGSSGNGIVFAINLDASGFTNLHEFAPLKVSGNTLTNYDGANLATGLVFSNNTLYGTASHGGDSGNGTLFSIFLPTQLILNYSGNKVILTWPSSAAGFTLQSATNLSPSAVWSAVSPAPAIVNGQNTVTNAISGARMFYRLSQ